MTGHSRCKFWQHFKGAFSEVADDIRRVNVPVDERMSGTEEGVNTAVRCVARPLRLWRSMYLLRISRAWSKNGSSWLWAVTARTVCGSCSAAARFAAPVKARAARGIQCIVSRRVKRSRLSAFYPPRCSPQWVCLPPTWSLERKVGSRWGQLRTADQTALPALPAHPDIIQRV